MGETLKTATGAAETAPAPEQSVTKDHQDMPSPNRTTSPAFQFYPKDFISSTKVQRMTLTEVGAYMLLLSHCWLDGSLPADLTEVAKIVKMPAPRFRKLWAGALSECFVEKNGRLINVRLDQERRKQIEYRRRQSDHGKKGGRRVAFPEPSSTLPPSPSPRDLEIGDSNPSSALRKEKASPPLDVAFATFRDAYPQVRREAGPMVQQAYMRECHKAGGPHVLLDALENHKTSDQWADPSKVPAMLTWLDKERWRQRFDPKTDKPATKKWGNWRPAEAS